MLWISNNTKNGKKYVPSCTSSPAVRSPKTWENLQSSGMGGESDGPHSATSAAFGFILQLYGSTKRSSKDEDLDALCPHGFTRFVLTTDELTLDRGETERRF
jgi:hypothetical protein